MSIEKISSTEWDHTFPVGERNDSHEIIATKEGLLIFYDIITWEELEKAKNVVIGKTML